MGIKRWMVATLRRFSPAEVSSYKVYVRMKGLTHHVTDEVLAVVGDTSDDSVTSHCQHSLQPHRHTSQGVVNTHYEIECSP